MFGWVICIVWLNVLRFEFECLGQGVDGIMIGYQGCGVFVCMIDRKG